MIRRLSHLGLCVADLERSRRFYCEGLGFAERSRLQVSGAESERLLGLPAVELEAVYLEREGLRLELLHYASPGTVGEPAARPMNALGLTHLSFRVEAMAEVVARLVELGGRPLADTEVVSPRFGTAAVFVLDPDGTRLELLEAPGDPALLPGEALR